MGICEVSAISARMGGSNFWQGYKSQRYYYTKSGQRFILVGSVPRIVPAPLCHSLPWLRHTTISYHCTHTPLYLLYSTLPLPCPALPYTLTRGKRQLYPSKIRVGYEKDPLPRSPRCLNCGVKMSSYPCLIYVSAPKASCVPPNPTSLCLNRNSSSNIMWTNGHNWIYIRFPSIVVSMAF